MFYRAKLLLLTNYSSETFGKTVRHLLVYVNISEFPLTDYPAGISLLKVSNGKTRSMSEFCSMISIRTPKRHKGSSVIFIVNFEQVLNSEQVNAGWVIFILSYCFFNFNWKRIIDEYLNFLSFWRGLKFESPEARNVMFCWAICLTWSREMFYKTSSLTKRWSTPSDNLHAFRIIGNLTH